MKKNNWKINLLNLNDLSLTHLMKLMKGKKFHSNQIMDWIYKKNITDINLIKNINLTLKNNIKMICEINHLILKKETINIDNTIKWLIKLNEKHEIETVAIPNSKNHFTLCISSQVGCILNCSFCYTGKHGFQRNLNTDEIVNQILLSNNRIYNLFKKKITNIVVMGMGEPLLNINNILSAIDIITHKNSYNIHRNKITVSTSGIISKFNLLSSKKIPLALSLHATNDNTRSSLMPINKKYSIKKILAACKDYAINNKLTIEYVMLKNINDSKNDALMLAKLLKNIICKICLIPFNSFPGSQYKSTNHSDILAFQKILKEKNIVTTIRKKMGYDINAACGQLVGNCKKK